MRFGGLMCSVVSEIEEPPFTIRVSEAIMNFSDVVVPNKSRF